MENNIFNSSKSSNGKPQLITAGLDLGTTKVCSIIANEGQTPNSLNILGLGITESEGMKRGVVSNIDKMVKSIRKVIDQVEMQSGLKIDDVVVGIAGDHIESFRTRGIISISNPDNEIRKQDVERLLEDTRNVSIPAERKILHIIPQDYIIDGQDGIIDPVGMSGIRMEANVHVVTGMNSSLQNIFKCIERAGLKVKDIILEPIASSNAILTEEEKEVGVAIVDIGGGTTDIAIFEENIIRYTSVFGIAGHQITDDIKHGMGIVKTEAERIKREYGHAFYGSIMDDHVFMISGVGGRKPIEVTKGYLCQIIQPRMEEILEFAMNEIRRSGYASRLGAGVVLTGGSSLLRGMEDLAAAVFGLPVKIGIPSGITYSGLAPEVESPIYSTAVGLALHSMNKHNITDELKATDKKVTDKKSKGTFLNKIKEFITEL